MDKEKEIEQLWRMLIANNFFTLFLFMVIVVLIAVVLA